MMEEATDQMPPEVARPDGAPDAADHHPVLTVLDVLGKDRQQVELGRSRGVVKRLLTGDGGNVITFTFAPGQSWPDHQAAHPILVQCLEGELDFTVAERKVRLGPVVVVHLNERIIHRVECPEQAPESNVLLLTMLTGERPAAG